MTILRLAEGFRSGMVYRLSLSLSFYEPTDMSISEDKNPLPHDPVGTTDRKVDVDRVHRLIADIEQELAGIPEDSPGLQNMRNELEALKETLDAPGKRHEHIGGGLRSVRTRLQDMAAAMEGEVLKDTPYIAEIGRILGMV